MNCIYIFKLCTSEASAFSGLSMVLLVVFVNDGIQVHGLHVGGRKRRNFQQLRLGVAKPGGAGRCSKVCGQSPSATNAILKMSLYKSLYIELGLLHLVDVVRIDCWK